jgi:hypothetical protein
MLSVIMLNVIMLGVVMLNVIMLSVVAPMNNQKISNAFKAIYCQVGYRHL